jgi:hypothetical protein
MRMPRFYLFLTLVVLIVAWLFASPVIPVNAQATRCIVVGKWIDASGNEVNPTPPPAINSSIKIKIEFQDPPGRTGLCNGTSSVVVSRNGSPIGSPCSATITASNREQQCAVDTSSAGAITYLGTFNPSVGGGVSTVSSGQPLNVGGGGAGGNNNNTTPTVTPTPSPTGVPPVTIRNPISFNSLGELVVGLIKFLMTMLGALSVLFIIIGAVRMVVSAGNETQVKAGKSTVTWAVIGLIVALLAFTFISLVQSVLGRT